MSKERMERSGLMISKGYKHYNCHMYSLDNKSKRINKRVRVIKAMNEQDAKRIWAETQIGCFELVGIEERR